MSDASKQRNMTNHFLNEMGPVRPEALKRFAANEAAANEHKQWVANMDGISVKSGPYPYNWSGKGWALAYFNDKNVYPTFCPFVKPGSFTLDVKFGPRDPKFTEPARVPVDVY